ncbi:MAG: PepSY domain-containing protein [Cyclobacteriaceae bacterium]|nr:PepSY domain-containing protein [Cyclobacteriaceae bacterium]
MRAYFLISALLFFIVAVFSCKSDDEITILDSQQASNQALDMISGQVIETELDSSGIAPAWEVTVLTDTGSEVEFYFTQDGGALIQIEGDDGPFNYDLDPGLGLISFSSAKQAALDEYEGDIVKWELEQDPQGKWVYEFVIAANGNEKTIKIDAQSGAAI